MRDSLANENIVDHSPTSRAYASLLRRFQALVFDLVIYCTVLAAGVLVPELFALGRFGIGLWFGTAIAFLLSYEALLVGLRGGTVGHFRYRIRVWDAAADVPIGVRRAFGRAVVKGVLGMISMVLMLVTARAQSLHDLMFHSIVVPVDPTLVSDADIIVPQPVPADGMPSRSRRAIVITTYSLVSLVAVAIMDALVMSNECLQMDNCNGTESLVGALLSLAWLIATVTFVVLGWRGSLIGCQRQERTAPLVG